MTCRRIVLLNPWNEEPIDDVTDQHPSEAAVRGDSDPDRQLSDRLADHLTDLEHYVSRRLGDRLRVRESVGDVVQSVCRHVLAEGDRLDYRGEDAFRGFLRTCARHKIYQKNEFHGADKRDHRREIGSERYTRGARLAELAQTSQTPSRVLMRADRIAEMLLAIEKLPALYRDAVRMHRLEGLRSAEIAERTGSTPGAVRNQVYRGLAMLAMSMRDRASGS